MLTLIVECFLWCPKNAAEAQLRAVDACSLCRVSVKAGDLLQGAQKESLFSVVLCSCVPEMVANIMHGSSQAAVSRAIVAAIRRQIVSDPELRKQHKAAAAIYRPRVAAPTQVLLLNASWLIAAEKLPLLLRISYQVGTVCYRIMSDMS